MWRGPARGVVGYSRAMERPIEIEPAALAVTLFEQGFTCSQAVLAAFAGRHGLDRDTALRIACAYGGGGAQTGGACGAVSGALMAIGLAHGSTRVDDEAAREKTWDAARALLDRFRREHGSDRCRDLLGVDIGTPEGREAAAKAGLFRTHCPVFVRSAARIASSLT